MTIRKQGGTAPGGMSPEAFIALAPVQGGACTPGSGASRANPG
jgi:hypothetical protein